MELQLQDQVISKLSSLLEWASTKSLAHFFAITRYLERENVCLKAEVSLLKSELSSLRQESVQKIYQAVGLSGNGAVDDSGVPLELFEQEKQIVSTTPITDLVQRAEQEAWVAWQKEERLRLENAKLISEEFHTI